MGGSSKICFIITILFAQVGGGAWETGWGSGGLLSCGKGVNPCKIMKKLRLLQFFFTNLGNEGWVTKWIWVKTS